MSMAIQQRAHPVRQRSGLSGLVDGIGTEQFGSRLVGLLHDVCGADHCAAFQLGGDTISALAFSSFDPAQSRMRMVERYVCEGLWRKDPALSMARIQVDAACDSLIHVDLNDRGYDDLRPHIYPQVRDRVVVCGRRNNIEFGLSVVRSDPSPEFKAGALERLADLSDTLLSAMAKHVSVLMSRPNVASALTDLQEIENCFHARSELPRRELEVCARILYGLSSIGISLDLGVGEESVKTYRKRAYQRLNIGCERELLHWYLLQWSVWRGHHYAPTRSFVH
jgi:DNA-binding CsgD family transcriptional regulator